MKKIVFSVLLPFCLISSTSWAAPVPQGKGKKGNCFFLGCVPGVGDLNIPEGILEVRRKKIMQSSNSEIKNKLLQNSNTNIYEELKKEDVDNDTCFLTNENFYVSSKEIITHQNKYPNETFDFSVTDRVEKSLCSAEKN